MLTSALIMSCGALAVALIDDRVPVFEIVVCHFPYTIICEGAIKFLPPVCLSLVSPSLCEQGEMGSVRGVEGSCNTVKRCHVASLF